MLMGAQTSVSLPTSMPWNPAGATPPLAQAQVWRGLVMDTYALEKLTGWTPELSPPPDSPLFRWRVLAGDYPVDAGGLA